MHLKRTVFFIVQFFFGLDTREKLKICLAVIITMLTIAFNVGIPLVFRQLLNTLNAPPQIIGMVLFFYCFLWLLSNLIAQIRAFLVNLVLEDLVRTFTIKFFEQLHKQSTQFHVGRRTGAVSAILSRAEQGLEGFFSTTCLFLGPTVLELIFATCIVFYLYGSFCSLILLAVLTFYCSVNILGIEWINKAHEHYNHVRTKAKAFTIDSLLNVEAVTYFSNQDFEVQRLQEILNEQRKAGYSVNMRSTFLQTIQSLVMAIGVSLLLRHSAIVQNMKIADFVLMHGYIFQFFMPLSYFGYIVQQIRRSIVDIGDACSIMQEKIESYNGANVLNANSDKATIEFKNVCFSYDDKREVLRDITFEVPMGKTVAIVGHTGSGKSTITRLLFCLYEPTKGEIYISGCNIKLLTSKCISNLIGIVPQDVTLFNNTIYYNIAYGKIDATEAEVENAAILVGLHYFVATLPDGYNTLVGERGLKISGGEKQRIAIARAIIKSPRIYLFDEATSALDSQTEKIIQQNIRKVSQGSTTLIIAHRLSTVLEADEILVLENGEIIERGNYNQLLQLEGVFADLWREQINKQLVA